MKKILISLFVIFVSSPVFAQTSVDKQLKAENLYNLGMSYYSKENRSDEDEQKALICWEMAAELGYQEAKDALQRHHDEKNAAEQNAAPETSDEENSTVQEIVNDTHYRQDVSSHNTESSDSELKGYDYDTIFVAVEQQAEFPGGLSAMTEWLSNNIIYPPVSQSKKIEGRVIVKFVVERDGSIGDAMIVKGVNSELDQEALRVVKAMPDWKPGRVQGKAVRCYFVIPISFKLQDGIPTE